MRARARIHTHIYIHTRFLGELLDRSQSPPFLPPFLRCDRADEEDKRRKRERKRETERKILGESWNPRLETRANKPRLRLQTSRLNARTPAFRQSWIYERPRWKRKKKEKKFLCVQCVIVPTQVSPLPSTCFRLHMMAGYRVPMHSYTIREN